MEDKAGIRWELIEVINPTNDNESVFASVEYKWQEAPFGHTYQFIKWRYFPGTGSKTKPKWLTDKLVYDAYLLAAIKYELPTEETDIDSLINELTNE